jgi:hypothetical protein
MKRNLINGQAEHMHTLSNELPNKISHPNGAADF